MGRVKQRAWKAIEGCIKELYATEVSSCGDSLRHHVQCTSELSSETEKRKVFILWAHPPLDKGLHYEMLISSYIQVFHA